MVINCPNCNKIISDKATSCPHCGFSITSDGETTWYPISKKLAEDKSFRMEGGLISIQDRGFGLFYFGENKKGSSGYGFQIVISGKKVISEDFFQKATLDYQSFKNSPYYHVFEYDNDDCTENEINLISKGKFITQNPYDYIAQLIYNVFGVSSPDQIIIKVKDSGCLFFATIIIFIVSIATSLFLV